jgi:predicted nucleotidyltransferase component of viral defense system
VLAYNLETILAEKYETIIRRSIANTRIRDFYDIYVLLNFQSSNIDFALLKEAIYKTSEHRNSLEMLYMAGETIDLLADDKGLQDLWVKYQKEYDYAKDIKWDELIGALRRAEVLI